MPFGRHAAGVVGAIIHDPAARQAIGVGAAFIIDIALMILRNLLIAMMILLMDGVYTQELKKYATTSMMKIAAMGLGYARMIMYALIMSAGQEEAAALQQILNIAMITNTAL